MQKEPASTAESSRDLDQRQAAVLQRQGQEGASWGAEGAPGPSGVYSAGSRCLEALCVWHMEAHGPALTWKPG